MKRLSNTAALEIKFLPLTHRLKITQTNNCKWVFVDLPDELDTLEYINVIIQKVDCISSYSVIKDRRTNRDYIIGLEFHNKTIFPDVILEIKGLKKKGGI